MKYIIALLFIAFSFSYTLAQATESAHETIVAQGVEQVKLDLGSKDVTIKSTKGSRIIVETTIQISIPNITLLKYLVKSGRYQLETSIDPATSTMTISRKKNTNVLIVKGEECKEVLSFTILLPETIKYANNTPISASN